MDFLSYCCLDVCIIMRSDIAEMKTSLRFLCESFDGIKSSNHKLEKALSEIHKLNQQLSGRVVELEKENQRKDATIDNLEKAVESLEMYSKKNNVVFSGLDLKATTFARVARVAGTAEEQGAGEQSGGEFATLRAKVLLLPIVVQGSVQRRIVAHWRSGQEE